MSSRIGFALAVLLLLLAAVLRFENLSTLPPGLQREEIMDIRIVETVRAGRIEAFYNLALLGGQGGREGLYHIILAAATTATGSGLIGYRALSLFVGMLTLALIYAVGMRLYGSLAGVATMALLAVGMWPILLARTIGRETFLPLLASIVLLALAKALPVYQRNPDHEPGTMPYAALGLALGLGFYIHPSSFLITLASMIFIIYIVLSRRPLSRRALSYTSFAILVMIIVAMPYLISSIRLPELDGAGRLFGNYTVSQNPPLQAIFGGIFGLFFSGDANPAHNLPNRPLVDLVSGVLLLIGFVTALRHWRRPRFALPLIMALILAPVAFLTLNSPDFQAYSGLLPVLALFFGLGAAALHSSLAGNARRVMSIGLVGLLIFNIGWAVHDLFSQWPQSPEVQTVYNARAGQIAHYLDLTSETTPTVICIPSIPLPRPTAELTNTQLISLMMNRKNSPMRRADCGTSMIFTNGGERQQVILPEDGTLERIHPYVRDWLLSGVVEPNLPANSVIMMDVSQELAHKIGSFTTTTPVEYAPEAPGGAQIIYPPVRFGGNITFLGYEKESGGSYQPGGDVTSITYWRVDGTPPPDLRLFTHILSDPAAIISQRDTISVEPGQLESRDVFIQITFVRLPTSTPDGQYQVSIGAYQSSDNMRLPVFDGDLSRGTRLFLAERTITIAAQSGGN